MPQNEIYNQKFEKNFEFLKFWEAFVHVWRRFTMFSLVKNLNETTQHFKKSAPKIFSSILLKSQVLFQNRGSSRVWFPKFRRFVLIFSIVTWNYKKITASLCRHCFCVICHFLVNMFTSKRNIFKPQNIHRDTWNAAWTTPPEVFHSNSENYLPNVFKKAIFSIIFSSCSLANIKWSFLLVDLSNSLFSLTT